MIKEFIENYFLIGMGSITDSFVKVSLILILLGWKDFFKSKRFIISVLIFGIYISLSYNITDSGLRIILLFIFTYLATLFVSNFPKNQLVSTAIITFVIWISLVLIDVMFNIIVTVLLQIDMSAYRNNAYLVAFINYLVFFFLILFFYIKPIRRKIMKVSNIEINDNNRYYFILIFMSVVSFSIILYLCIFVHSTVLILLFVVIMIISYTIIVLITIKTNNLRNKIQAEHDILLTNLSEYENLLDRQRILNHENKNQLLVIRGMISKYENAIEYIDSLVDNQYKDSDDLIMKTNRIPSGGLKGLIYYKMLIMRDKHINVSLEVNSNINRINFSNMSTKNNQELCKIIGVFLDNAIQEVENLKDKNVNIIVENENNNLIVKISNNYGYSDINHVGDKDYTTKGKGHGYGLRLVKNIVDSNKLFEHKTEINGKVFSQIVRLKIKNDW